MAIRCAKHNWVGEAGEYCPDCIDSAGKEVAKEIKKKIEKNKRGGAMGVGFPAILKLEDFGDKLFDAFREPAYQVGSSLDSVEKGGKRGWRDVDVRMILPDEKYAALRFGDPKSTIQNARWAAVCLAFSVLGREMTGLPIDFQIQQQSYANEKFKGPRSALILTRVRKNI